MEEARQRHQRIANGTVVDSPYRTPVMPIPVSETTIQAGSGSSRAKRAMNSEPTTKPTDVSPSCRPYSNSVAWSSR